ncbi:MAG: acetyl-CoA C-acyltransferase [Candidatus Dormibacteria bacterium]
MARYGDDDVLIVAAARTPFGRFGGSLASLNAVELGAHCIAEAVQRAGIEGATVDQVIMGTVVTAGMGQVPARQAAIRAGLPLSVSALTINKVCASSLKAVNLGATLIRAGEAEVVIAGGMESMSGAPYLLPGARFGLRLGNAQVVDAMQLDGLICPEGNTLMADYGSEVAAEYEVSREDQDRWAVRSQARYAEALAGGRLSDELVPVEVAQRRGAPALVDADEQPRPLTTFEGLSALTPLHPGGSITPGNAPGINDGAAAIALVSGRRGRELGLQPLAIWRAQGEAAEPVKYLATVPAYALQAALRKLGRKATDLDLLEINEAFAAVAITSTNLLGVDPQRVNVNGGAVAIGHPIGASGARLLMTLVFELRRRGGGLGGATICSGMAQGEATIVEVPA